MATRVELYLFAGDRALMSWTRPGPSLVLCDIVHAPAMRLTARVGAAANGERAWVYHGEDLCQSGRLMGGPLPAGIDKVRHAEPGGASEAGTVCAGVLPAALFRSRDGGET